VSFYPERRRPGYLENRLGRGIFRLPKETNQLAEKVRQHGPENREKTQQGYAAARNLRQSQATAATRLMAGAKSALRRASIASLATRPQIEAWTLVARNSGSGGGKLAVGVLVRNKRILKEGNIVSGVFHVNAFAAVHCGRPYELFD